MITDGMGDSTIRWRTAWAIFPADDEILWERWTTSDVTSAPPSSAVPCLEDQIPYKSDRKAAARAHLETALQQDRQPDAVIWPRVNHVSTEFWREDLRMLAGSAVDGLVIPKVESVAQVQEVEEWLVRCEAEAGSAAETPLVLMIESPLGVERAFDIASASVRCWALMFGREDYNAAMQGLKDPGGLAEGLPEFLPSRSRIANAARAAGLEVIDGSAGAGASAVEMLRDAQLSARLGYTGKIAASDAEALSIIEGFTPSPQAISFALDMVNVAMGRSTVAAAEEVTPPVVKQAMLTLRRAGIDPALEN